MGRPTRSRATACALLAGPVVAALTLAGCATARGAGLPSDAGATTTTTYIELETASVELRRTRSNPSAAHELEVPAERAWQLLPLVYEELQLPVNVMETQARLVGSQRTVLRRQLGGVRLSRYFECGEHFGEAKADSYALTMTLRTQVVPAGSGASQLRTLVEATARSISEGGASVDCATTGALEQRIVQRVTERARH